MKRGKKVSKLVKPDFLGLVTPLEHHSFRRLLKTVVQEASFGGNVVSRKSYEFVYYNNWKYEEVIGCWNLVTFSHVTEELMSMAKEFGLLKIDSVHCCVSCRTSEYVRRNEKLNGGAATCLRCGAVDLGWE